MDAQQTVLNRPMRAVFWGLVRTPAEQRDMAAIAAAIEETAKAWRMIEAALQRHAIIAGSEFTLVRHPVGRARPSVVRHGLSGPDPAGMPALRAWYDRLCQRPAYQQHVMATPIS